MFLSTNNYFEHNNFVISKYIWIFLIFFFHFLKFFVARIFLELVMIGPLKGSGGAFGPTLGPSALGRGRRPHGRIQTIKETQFFFKTKNEKKMAVLSWKKKNEKINKKKWKKKNISHILFLVFKILLGTQPITYIWYDLRSKPKCADRRFS